MSDAQGQVFDYTLNHSWDEAMKAFGINSCNVMQQYVYRGVYKPLNESELTALNAELLENDFLPRFSETN